MKQNLPKLALAIMSLLMMSTTTQAGKKVHTIGDSTMATYDENTETKRGWGMYFGNFLTNGWSSINYAKGGRDSRGGYNELWQNAKGKVEAGDYVLIQFAHNDEKYNGMDNLELQAYYTSIGDAANAAAVKSDGRGTVPSTTYKQCLKQIVDAVKAKGATPVLVSAVARCYFSAGSIRRNGRHDLGDSFSQLTATGIKEGQKVAADDHTMDYPYHMQQLAKEEGVQFIDMTKATTELYESYGPSKCHDALFCEGDNTHYNLTGALMAARLCAGLLKDAGILADNIVIPSDLSIAPAEANLGDVYLGQSASRELTLSGLGLEPAAGTIVITATEGIQLSTDKKQWQSQLEVSYESGTLIKTFYVKATAAVAGLLSGMVTATLGERKVEVPVTLNAIQLGGGTPFTVKWPLTTNDESVIDGSVNAETAVVEGMVKYGNTTEQGLMVSTSDGGAWTKAEDVSPNQYVELTVAAPEGQAIDVNHISMLVGARGGNGMRCNVYYSTDGFVTRTTIYAPTSMVNKEMNLVDVAPVVHLEAGECLQVRVYPWYTSDATGKWLCVKDVEVSGQADDGGGVSFTGSITFPLSEGGLEQADQAVTNPNELNAGFASREWSYDGDADVTIATANFDGIDGATTPMLQMKFNGDKTATLSTVPDANCTLTLTMTPAKGFTFVPMRVSFVAGKFASNNPHLTLAVAAGAKEQTLLDNVELNRSKTDPRVDPSAFSEELNGFTATEDKPLRLGFSFLNVQGTRAAGIGNLVIEGTLMGAADNPTGIRTFAGQQAVTVYTIDGKQVRQPQRGLSIVRSADGSVRKVIAK